jgi:xylulokinase
MDCVIACDLGTGGVKSAVFGADGVCLAESVVAYETFYPAPGRHEQRPLDWWNSVTSSIRTLLARPEVEASRIRGISISGHSLGCVPLDADGELLQHSVPIWSDGRAQAEAEAFFALYNYDLWYETTGNGFPAALYTLFKVLWLRRHLPDVFNATHTITGTKDYINFRLTGRLATDPSYASGTGVYDLAAGTYSGAILDASGIDASLFAEILSSTAVVGKLLPDVAAALGLPQDVQIMAGGVDNSCMALGSRTFRDGDIFCSMGSSSWLTIACKAPLLDRHVRPYSFAHVVPGLCISATSIFSSGTTVNWVRDILMSDVASSARAEARDVYQALADLAQEAQPGSGGLLFVPTLGGGTSLEGGPAVRGAFVGLDLGHGRPEIMRATFEGIALALRVALDALRKMTEVSDEIIIVGGGARSALWRQIFADIFDCRIVKTVVDQQAAALGAAALAFVGLGIWRDFEPIVGLHAVEHAHSPDPAGASLVERQRSAFLVAMQQQKTIAVAISALR